MQEMLGHASLLPNAQDQEIQRLQRRFGKGDLETEPNLYARKPA